MVNTSDSKQHLPKKNYTSYGAIIICRQVLFITVIIIINVIFCESCGWLYLFYFVVTFPYSAVTETCFVDYVIHNFVITYVFELIDVDKRCHSIMHFYWFISLPEEDASIFLFFRNLNGFI
ncbi:hypothetical protein, unlikely [Trypanosoma brucei gambiense DAL972]|uniref:Uncharacterized protein n=1 Tax=Trypanosoma brucei gambiense (strain MHOM/CI/86/DAL972) TaxID=679716 RepID=C9ZNV3_TRYB9|nr:hypothetical protein, unlikely [Trypanosoma brucei gambiense DAL972]CBH11081.1 hypothetical protein, unlikely [Trypanosoma brucei gambiense DAL972]|eukprot:XP_011773368.1 hypothetical protein, unlikely [Trypanosoma brucei gambiense DAL972]